jgi:hypothetical protein
VHKLTGQADKLYYFVVLRDPVERAISQYYMTQTWEQPSGHPLCQLSNRDLMGFYQSPWTQNLQTRTIAGILATRIGGLINLNKDTTGRIVFGAAKKNLKSAYTEFGTTERFEETVARFADCLDFSYQIPEKRHASLPDRPTEQDMSSVKVEKIKKLNSLDCRLYEFARKEFNKKLL